MMVLFFAWDLGIKFLGIPNWMIEGFFKKKIIFGLKAVIEKCVGCFLAYLFLRVFVSKRYKKCVCVCVCVCVCLW